MLIRKFDRAQLDSEPHHVLFKDLYPWDAIEDTPFGASLAVIEPGGQTMVHNHNPAETFIICQGRGTMSINDETAPVAAGDVIYLPPDSVHNLKNDSDSEALMFLSVFWDAPENDAEEDLADAADAGPRLFMPSPPTPNGPLHLGHLAGPYLIADVMRRYDRLQGRPSKFVCLSDDHQSYVELRAGYDGASEAETARRYSQELSQLLRDLDAAPDVLVCPSQDANYRQAIAQAFTQLPLAERDGQALYCEGCARFAHDGHVVGECPHCGAGCRGFVCESCCLPNRTLDLGAPECLHCEQPLTPRPLRQLVFSLEPFKQRLAQLHSQLSLTPRLRSLAARMLSLPQLEVVASHPSDWGVPVPQPGFAGQVISAWLEVALAGISGAVHFFGYDNAFLYLVQDPAVNLALQRPLAAALNPNDYLLLEEGKMSTSSNHSLAARTVLDQVPADLLRLYLAGIRPEQAESRCSASELEQFCSGCMQGPWQGWLETLGRALTQEAGSKAPEPSIWSSEQQQFLAQLEDLRRRADQGYARFSLREVSRVLHELVERAFTFQTSQSYLIGLPGLEAERHTGLALELAAARLLAQLSAPVMPGFAAALWKHLGYREPADPLRWPEQIALVAPGQRVLAAAGLSARRYFVAPRPLTPA